MDEAENYFSESVRERFQEIFSPFQLGTVVKTARKNPVKVDEMLHKMLDAAHTAATKNILPFLALVQTHMQEDEPVANLEGFFQDLIPPMLYSAVPKFPQILFRYFSQKFAQFTAAQDENISLEDALTSSSGGVEEKITLDEEAFAEDCAQLHALGLLESAERVISDLLCHHVKLVIARVNHSLGADCLSQPVLRECEEWVEEMALKWLQLMFSKVHQQHITCSEEEEAIPDMYLHWRKRLMFFFYEAFADLR
tara:strand:+ start:811 stop:1569 length:759 start_codon:yes stop_codon:yes gene_type:complete